MEFEDVKEIQKEITNVEIENFKTLAKADVGETIQALQNKEIFSTVKDDEQVKQQLKDNAKKIISTQTDTITTKVRTDNLRAKFDANKDACQVYGVSESCQMWKQKLMTFGSNIWFCIYFIIASFTVAPISIFSNMLSNVFKKGWIALLVGIILYLFIAIGVPLLVALV